MKIARIALLMAAFILALSLAACGDSRETTAAKLVSAYFDAGEGGDAVSVLKTETYEGGFLALVRYTGSGEHLLLFKVAKDAAGEYAITHAGEGGVAKGGGYGVSLLVDGDRAVLFGSLDDTAGYRKLSFTFEDGSTRDVGIAGAKAYILVLQGEGAEGTPPAVKDFTLVGQGNAEAGSYKDYVAAGNSITRTNFMEIKGE